MNKTRSLIGYYGGKSAMSHFIADQLDYKNTNLYIEMFGGGARVLLNKPRHVHEIYADYSSSLCSLMELMADPVQSVELIHRIYNTGYSQEEFDRAKEIVEFVDADPTEYYLEKLKEMLKKYNIFPDMDNFWWSVLEMSVTPKERLEMLWKEKILNPSTTAELKKNLSTLPVKAKNEILNHYKELLNKYEYVIDRIDDHGYCELHLDNDILGKYTPMDAAVATYVVYTQSRDNMGKYWSKEKFKSIEAYHRHMCNLYDCADRLENVEVHVLDSMLFFTPPNTDDNKNSISKWLDDPYIMLYADPSYISPVDESKMLVDSIDWGQVDYWSKELLAIQFKEMRVIVDEEYKKEQERKKQGQQARTSRTPKIKLPKNLGENIYSKSFDYIQHENFLKCIENAKCKMMVSNYDLQLYNKYLNPDSGWRKITFETKTTVGSKKDNRRVECLWCNFD